MTNDKRALRQRGAFFRAGKSLNKGFIGGSARVA
jgi:hypothetical protein